MDLGTAIIGSLCVAICAMPFVLTTRNRKKKEQQLETSIIALAQQYYCKITQHEICGNYIIGVDEKKNFLFFQNHLETEIKQQVIDLSTINNCYACRQNSKNENLERLELKFRFTDKSKPEIALEFYNQDINFQLSGEIQSIEKWNELVRKQLISIKP
ncbi:hypothetical protein Q4566_13300 [Tamlana sp. 2_MG-2023]|uniref:hypothetical protein n=1 Tax=unclassified Tamlana TaxID=2614803 RepID=UPI0026E2F82A|nr:MULTISPECIES: hypothetical protein [unclassified Tamlana]MDO6761181.1 hypothetical protein [Tamlana sp. 2_MG-2023]MDO6791486.1 hypothetical protein [Tamlana sp. 1_MG-2023]